MEDFTRTDPTCRTRAVSARTRFLAYCSGEVSAVERRRGRGPHRSLRRVPRAGRRVRARLASGGATGLAETESQRPAGEPIGPGRIGRYVVLERMGGRDGRGVHAAYDPQLGRRVALVLIAPFMAADPLAQARMLREAQAMALLAHPNVAAIHDAGIHHDRVWLAMEFIDGETLVAWLAARPRSWREVLAMFVAAGEAWLPPTRPVWSTATSSPTTCWSDRDGRPRVVDFGLARGTTTRREWMRAEVDDDALRRPLTRPGATPGTPRYMAPEQWLGRAVDPRTDAFAFCVALWEALYGEHPFPTTSAAALAEAVIGEQVRTPLAAGRVPGFVRQALRRGLASDPGRRFPTMAALLAALRSDPRRRNLRRALIVAVIVVIAVVSGWYSLARARGDRGMHRAGRARSVRCGIRAAAKRWSGRSRRAAIRWQPPASRRRPGASTNTLLPGRDSGARPACSPRSRRRWRPRCMRTLKNCLDERLLGLGVTLEILRRPRDDRAPRRSHHGDAIGGLACRNPVQLRAIRALPANERGESAAIRRAR